MKRIKEVDLINFLDFVQMSPGSIEALKIACENLIKDVDKSDEA